MQQHGKYNRNTTNNNPTRIIADDRITFIDNDNQRNVKNPYLGLAKLALSTEMKIDEIFKSFEIPSVKYAYSWDNTLKLTMYGSNYMRTTYNLQCTDAEVRHGYDIPHNCLSTDYRLIDAVENQYGGYTNGYKNPRYYKQCDGLAIIFGPKGLLVESSGFDFDEVYEEIEEYIDRFVDHSNDLSEEDNSNGGNCGDGGNGGDDSDNLICNDKYRNKNKNKKCNAIVSDDNESRTISIDRANEFLKYLRWNIINECKYFNKMNESAHIYDQPFMKCVFEFATDDILEMVSPLDLNYRKACSVLSQKLCKTIIEKYPDLESQCYITAHCTILGKILNETRYDLERSIDIACKLIESESYFRRIEYVETLYMERHVQRKEIRNDKKMQEELKAYNKSVLDKYTKRSPENQARIDAWFEKRAERIARIKQIALIRAQSNKSVPISTMTGISDDSQYNKQNGNQEHKEYKKHAEHAEHEEHNEEYEEYEEEYEEYEEYEEEPVE